MAPASLSIYGLFLKVFWKSVWFIGPPLKVFIFKWKIEFSFFPKGIHCNKMINQTDALIQ